jgi:hypothetical protein
VQAPRARIDDLARYAAWLRGITCDCSLSALARRCRAASFSGEKCSRGIRLRSAAVFVAGMLQNVTIITRGLLYNQR